MVVVPAFLLGQKHKSLDMARKGIFYEQTTKSKKNESRRRKATKYQYQPISEFLRHWLSKRYAENIRPSQTVFGEMRKLHL